MKLLLLHERAKLAAVVTALQGKNVGYIWNGEQAATAAWKGEFVETLRRLVDTWLTASRNYPEWQKRHPDLARIVAPAARRLQVLHVPPTFRPIWRTVSQPPKDLPDRAPFEAASLFLNLVTSWRSGDVGKCSHCDRYFLSESGHTEKSYCSRKCAKADSARRSMERKRKSERDEKLEAANALIRECQAHKRREDWKTWVTGNSGGGLTRHWLTRAVNQGWLRPPTKTKAGG